MCIPIRQAFSRSPLLSAQMVSPSATVVTQTATGRRAGVCCSAAQRLRLWNAAWRPQRPGQLTGDRAKRLQYHLLPTDDPVRALNILRAAAGLQPLSDEHDDQDG